MYSSGPPYEEMLCDKCIGRIQKGLAKEHEDLCGDCRKKIEDCALMETFDVYPFQCSRCPDDDTRCSPNRLESEEDIPF